MPLPYVTSNQAEKISKEVAKEVVEQSGGGGTTVIANPEISGTEADLTALQVGETKYKVPTGGSGGTTVVANPDLTGEEDTLEGIQVGENKYMLRYAPADDDEQIQYEHKIVLNPGYEGNFPIYDKENGFTNIENYITDALTYADQEFYYQNLFDKKTVVEVKDKFDNIFTFNKLRYGWYAVSAEIPLATENSASEHAPQVVAVFEAKMSFEYDPETGDTETSINGMELVKLKVNSSDLLDKDTYGNWPADLLNANPVSGTVDDEDFVEALMVALDYASPDIEDAYGNSWTPTSIDENSYEFDGMLVNIPWLRGKQFHQTFILAFNSDAETGVFSSQVSNIVTTEIGSGGSVSNSSYLIPVSSIPLKTMFNSVSYLDSGTIKFENVEDVVDYAGDLFLSLGQEILSEAEDQSFTIIGLGLFKGYNSSGGTSLSTDPCDTLLAGVVVKDSSQGGIFVYQLANYTSSFSVDNISTMYIACAVRWIDPEVGEYSGSMSDYPFSDASNYRTSSAICQKIHELIDNEYVYCIAPNN